MLIRVSSWLASRVQQRCWSRRRTRSVIGSRNQASPDSPTRTPNRPGLSRRPVRRPSNNWHRDGRRSARRWSRRTNDPGTRAGLRCSLIAGTELRISPRPTAGGVNSDAGPVRFVTTPRQALTSCRVWWDEFQGRCGIRLMVAVSSSLSDVKDHPHSRLPRLSPSDERSSHQSARRDGS